MTPATRTPAAQAAPERRKPAPTSGRPTAVTGPATAGRAVADPSSRGASRTSSARSAGHRGPVRARHHVRTEPERFDNANHVVDLALSGAGVHYDEHGVKGVYLPRIIPFGQI